MAVRDVKEYYCTLLDQWIGMTEELSGFQEDIEKGNITEDQLQEVVDEVNQMKINVDRLSYVMYLLDLPKRKNKKDKAYRASSNVRKYFGELNATDSCVYDENKSIMDSVRAELNRLTKRKNN